MCNVLCKIIAKTLANRLKFVMLDIIDESQSVFEPSRLITDNTIKAFKSFHWLWKGTSRNKKYMVIKLDMSKAYDRLEWGF